MKKIDFKKAIQTKTQSIPLSLLEAEEQIKSQIRIIDEIRDYINPLTNDEFHGLERTLLEEGITDPLIIWETTAKNAGIDETESMVYILIDGHHRYKISKKHQIPFQIVLKKYPSMDAVKAAMLDKQLNRRNLTPEQISYYRGLKYNMLKGSQIGGDKQINVANTLSKEFGVNEKTVRRDGTFADGLDKLAPNLKQEVLSGQAQIPKAAVSLIAKMNNVSNIENIEELEQIINPIKQEPSNGHSKEKVDEISSIKIQVRTLANKDFSKTDCEEMIKSLQSLLTLL